MDSAAERGKEKSENPGNEKKFMLEMIENEIGRLSLIQNFLDENDGKRTRYKTAAWLVPPRGLGPSPPLRRTLES